LWSYIARRQRKASAGFGHNFGYVPIEGRAVAEVSDSAGITAAALARISMSASSIVLPRL
jgi:hypothetical protein